MLEIWEWFASRAAIATISTIQQRERKRVNRVSIAYRRPKKGN